MRVRPAPSRHLLIQIMSIPVAMAVAYAAAGGFAAAGFPIPGPPKVEVDPDMTLEQAVGILEQSEDEAELESAALFLVQSKDDEALKALVRFLKDEAFLDRLDRSEAHRGHYRFLRIFRVLDAIGALSTEKAQASLLELARHELYQWRGGRPHRHRYASLIIAFGHINEPSDALLDYLEEQLASPILTIHAIISLGQMQSDRARRMIVDRLLAGEGKLGWFITYLRMRNNPNVVALYRRIIESDLQKVTNEQLRNFIIQTIFRPNMEWGAPPVISSAPPREEASTEVLRELLKMADIVLTQEGLYEQKTLDDVRKGREEIEDILATREAEQEHDDQ